MAPSLSVVIARLNRALLRQGSTQRSSTEQAKLLPVWPGPKRPTLYDVTFQIGDIFL